MFLSKRKNGIYYVIYKLPNGNRTSISTKTNSYTEATKFLLKFQEKNDSVVASRFVNTTLREFAIDFINYSQIVHSNSTTRDFETTFRYFLKFFGFTKILKELSNQNIQEYIHDRIKRSSIYQARKDLINLKSAFRRANEIGMLNYNPTAGIKSIRRPERLPMFYSKDDFQKLIASIDDIDIRDLTIFAVNTGLRQKELITLEWRNINMKSQTLTLDNNNFITKTRRVRSVPLNSTAFEILNKRKLFASRQYFLFKENQ